jgi:hypothetical protein
MPSPAGLAESWAARYPRISILGYKKSVPAGRKMGAGFAGWGKPSDGLFQGSNEVGPASPGSFSVFPEPLAASPG